MDRRRHHNYLRRFRRERGLTQRQVANILGLDDSTLISRWEKGVVLPKIRNVFKLAVLYRSSVDVIYSDLRDSLTDEIREREKSVLGVGREENE